MRLLLFVLLFLLNSIAAEAQKSGRVHVRGYTTKSGKYVAPYTRSAPRAKSSGSSSTKSYSAPRTQSYSAPRTQSYSAPRTKTYSAPRSKVAAPAPRSAQRPRATAASPRALAPRATKTPSSNAPKSKVTSPAPRSSNGRIIRSQSARQSFMRSSGYPNGRPGYVIDHVVPLACGGADAPSNMQWQTLEAAKAKDRVERRGCSAKR
jgi:hypothetical protein